MKRKLQTILNLGALLTWSFTAASQNQTDLQTQGAEYTHHRLPHARAEQLNAAIKASDLPGMTVKNYQGEKLGKVSDLAVDLESGHVVQVILSTGGFLGIGGTLTAVPPIILHHDAADKVVHLDASPAKLKGAPRFDVSKWDENTQSNQVIQTYAYYGERPYFIIDPDENWITNQVGELVRTLPRNMDGTLNTDAPRMVEKVRNAELARSVEEMDNSISSRNSDGTWIAPRYANRSLGNASLGRVHQARKLRGISVLNLQNENLGKVENLMVDLTAGRIVSVVLSSGAYLGLGGELSAIPPTAFRFVADQNVLQLDASREMLASSPHFQAGSWPDMSQPDYAAGVYRAYKVEPYFAAEAPREMDNSRRNVRDRFNQTLTPLDQGNSPEDTDLTARIRQEIVADKDLSVNAHNVKIITRNGLVTLRGPVNSAGEKSRVEEIAGRIARAENVNSQLEVNESSVNTTGN